MDYEKKYKESLERARKLKENPKAIFFEEKNVHVSDYIFPELAESEDEKIRKAILDYMTIMWGNSQDDVCGVHVEDAIAWLEKQGEQKSTEVRTTGYWHVEDVEQNPAWSEEDEETLKIIDRDLQEFYSRRKAQAGSPLFESQMQNIRWLKSLKDRVKG